VDGGVPLSSADVSLALLALLAQATVASPAPPADAAPPRLSLLRELVVAPGDTVEDATCLGCGIVVRGRVVGDTTAILGGVVVEGEAGRGPFDDVVALGGGVRVAPTGRAPASILSVGGPLRIEPGATASYDVDSLPWLHLPGQRQVFAEGAAGLFAAVLGPVLLGSVLLRQRGIAARDAGLVTAPLARGLLGAALVAGFGCLAANGDRLGRFEGAAVTAAAALLLAAGAAGSTGLASVAGRGLARLAGRRLSPGWGAAVLGAPALALALLVPILGAAAAALALFLSVGGAFAPRATLTATSPESSP
jgi:hypothetical protein